METLADQEKNEGMVNTDWEDDFDLRIAYHRYCEDRYCRQLHRRVNIFEVKQYIVELIEKKEMRLARRFAYFRSKLPESDRRQFEEILKEKGIKI